MPLYFLLHLADPARPPDGARRPAHDGVRLFLPTFFFLAAFAGWGAVGLADRIGRSRPGAGCSPAPRSRPWSCCPAAWGLVRIHPFELSYYNELIGGPRGAWARGSSCRTGTRRSTRRRSPTSTACSPTARRSTALNELTTAADLRLPPGARGDQGDDRPRLARPEAFPLPLDLDPRLEGDGLHPPGLRDDARSTSGGRASSTASGSSRWTTRRRPPAPGPSAAPGRRQPGGRRRGRAARRAGLGSFGAAAAGPALGRGRDEGEAAPGERARLRLGEVGPGLAPRGREGPRRPRPDPARLRRRPAPRPALTARRPGPWRLPPRRRCSGPTRRPCSTPSRSSSPGPTPSATVLTRYPYTDPAAIGGPLDRNLPIARASGRIGFGRRNGPGELGSVVERASEWVRSSWPRAAATEIPGEGVGAPIPSAGSGRWRVGHLPRWPLASAGRQGVRSACQTVRAGRLVYHRATAVRSPGDRGRAIADRASAPRMRSARPVSQPGDRGISGTPPVPGSARRTGRGSARLLARKWRDYPHVANFFASARLPARRRDRPAGRGRPPRALPDRAGRVVRRGDARGGRPRRLGGPASMGRGAGWSGRC